MKYQAIFDSRNVHNSLKRNLYVDSSELDWSKPARRSFKTTIFFGGHKAVVRPDPIPNSAVKRSLANGSGCIASARVGRRQIFPPY